MSWIVTNDGHEVSLANPVPNDYEAARVAHSLAQIVRFNGHAARPYSVAEHSLLCADIAEQVLHTDVFGAFACLWHDGHESITGDQPSPNKPVIGIGWRTFEHHHSLLVMAKHKLHSTRYYYQSMVRLVDLMALAIERDQLLPHTQPNGEPSTPWPVLEGIALLDTVDLMSPERVNRSWAEWRDLFLERHHALDAVRRSPIPVTLGTA